MQDDRPALINRLATLTEGEWRKIAAAMAWYYRPCMKLVIVPKLVRDFYGDYPPTAEQWATLRHTVSRARQNHRDRVKRHEAKAKTEAFRAHRRVYMRTYRAKKAATTPP